MSRCCCRTTAAAGCSRALTSHGQSLGQAISVSRLVPQQIAQICCPTAGQLRRARRIPHKGQTTAGIIVYLRPKSVELIGTPLAIHVGGCRARCCMSDVVFRRESAVEYFKELVDVALSHQGLNTQEMTAYYVVQLLASFLQRPLSEQQ